MDGHLGHFDTFGRLSTGYPLHSDTLLAELNGDRSKGVTMTHCVLIVWYCGQIVDKMCITGDVLVPTPFGKAARAGGGTPHKLSEGARGYLPHLVNL